MRGAAALPFLTLPEEVVEFSGWEIGDVGGERFPASEVLEAWDYARDLEIAAGLRLDWEPASEILQIPADYLYIRATLLVGTGAGRLPRRTERVCSAVLTPEKAHALLVGKILGRKLSGQIRLQLVLTLEKAPVQSGSLSPTMPGSRLWQEGLDILIEDGGASRFPMEAVSFSKAFKGASFSSSPWFVQWDPSLVRADFAEQVRLYVNADCEEVLNRFKMCDPPTLQAMMADVISQMASEVLAMPDVEDVLGQCEDGSVGRQVESWLSMAFPGEGLSSILTMKNRYPGRFRAAILALAEIGDVK